MSDARAARRHALDTVFARLSAGASENAPGAPLAASDADAFLRRADRRAVSRLPTDPVLREAMVANLVAAASLRAIRRFVRLLAGSRARDCLSALAMLSPGRGEARIADLDRKAAAGDMVAVLLADRDRKATPGTLIDAVMARAAARRATDPSARRALSVGETSDPVASGDGVDMQPSMPRSSRTSQRTVAIGRAVRHFIWHGTVPFEIDTATRSSLPPALLTARFSRPDPSHAVGVRGVAARLRLSTGQGMGAMPIASPAQHNQIETETRLASLATSAGRRRLAAELEGVDRARSRRILAELHPHDLARREASASRRAADELVAWLDHPRERLAAGIETRDLATLLRLSRRTMAVRLPMLQDNGAELLAQLVDALPPPALTPLIRAFAGRSTGRVLATIEAFIAGAGPGSGTTTRAEALRLLSLGQVERRQPEWFSGAFATAMAARLGSAPSVSPATGHGEPASEDPNARLETRPDPDRREANCLAYYLWYGSLPPGADRVTRRSLDHLLSTGCVPPRPQPPGAGGVVGRLATLLAEPALGRSSERRSKEARQRRRSRRVTQAAVSPNAAAGSLDEHPMRDPDNRVHVAPGWVVADPSDEAEARRMIRRHARAVVRRLPAEAQARHAVLDALSLLPPRSLRPIQRAMAGPAWPLVDGALRALARSGHEGAGSGGPLPGEVVRILDRRSRSGASSILAELVGAAAARTRTPVDKLLAALATQRRLVSLLPEIGRLAAMKAPDDDGPPGPRSFGGEQRPIDDADTEPCARLAVALRHLIRGKAAPDLAAAVWEALERGGPAATALLREALGRRAARAGLVALPRPIATRVLLSCVSGPGQAAQVLLPMLAVEPGLLAVLFAAIGEGTTDIMALAAVLRTCRAAAAEDAGPPPHGGTTDDIEVRIDNAGLVLLAPFLGRFFTKLRLTGPDDRLLPETAGRAVHLLQLLVAGRVDAREHRLVLNKILCGLDLALPIISAIEVTEEEAATADSLLLSVTQAWPPMNGTSIAGLRTTFLQRGGTLHRHREGWRLKVDAGPYDMLLDKLPWPISIVRLRGMATPLKVDWR